MTSTRPNAFLPQPAVDNIDFRLEDSIASATKALCALQRPDGHFVFELEADATIPAEYVLMRHYRGEPVDAALEAKIARYLRRIQSADGGWPLFHDGASDISASVKAYFALKMIGDLVDAPHMVRARNWILAKGGAANSNVFTRNLLALYGQVPWRAVPVMPVEIMLLPRWFPFHLDKVSYWARTVLVPLMVLNALKPRARNPNGIGIAELFVTPPEDVQHWPQGRRIRRGPGRKCSAVSTESCGRCEPNFPRTVRARAIDKAVKFVTERLNGEDGLGAIFPAMVNSLLMFDALGYADGDLRRSHGADLDREAAGGQRRRGLLPTLPFAGVGHGARRPRVARSGQCRMPSSASSLVSNGCSRCRSSRRLGTGPLPVQTSGLAAGLFNTPIRTIPISTTRPSWSWPWTAPRSACPMRHAAHSRKPLRAGRNGSLACRAGTAAGPRSMPTTNTTI